VKRHGERRRVAVEVRLQVIENNRLLSPKGDERRGGGERL